jgi:uncharacterized membrane protein
VKHLNKIAAVLAVIVGAMAAVAGGQVILLGKQMDYYVIDWLPYYNFAVGLLSMFVTAVLIWRRSRYGMPAAVVTLAAHAVVMLVLLTGYSAVVAPDSLRAMTVRIVAWVVIVALLYVQSRREKGVGASA